MQIKAAFDKLNSTNDKNIFIYIELFSIETMVIFVTI